MSWRRCHWHRVSVGLLPGLLIRLLGLLIGLLGLLRLLIGLLVVLLGRV